MNASMLAVLNDDERLLVAQTERAELDRLDEDEAVELHDRIRRARNKYTGQYRRDAAARVPEKGGRGKARPASKRAAMKAEAFEEALSRVSRRVAALARQSAALLRSERIEMARAAKQGSGPARPGPGSVPAQRNSSGVTGEPLGDRALRSPATEKRRGGTLALGARRQAKRDSR
jgi:hypothetical protein